MYREIGWLKLNCNGLVTTFKRRNYVPFVKNSDKQKIYKKLLLKTLLCFQAC